MPLQVSSVSATVVPTGGVGHCPQADFTFRGSVKIKAGTGTLTFQWLQPNGESSSLQTLVVQGGTRQATVTLNFSISGNGITRGAAVLHLISPIDVHSAPVNVSYVCP
jgi:hypothetical protein